MADIHLTPIILLLRYTRQDAPPGPTNSVTALESSTTTAARAVRLPPPDSSRRPSNRPRGMCRQSHPRRFPGVPYRERMYGERKWRPGGVFGGGTEETKMDVRGGAVQRRFGAKEGGRWRRQCTTEGVLRGEAGVGGGLRRAIGA